MLKIRLFDMNDAFIAERPVADRELAFWIAEVKRQIHDPQNAGKHPAGFEVLEEVGDSWLRFQPRNPLTRYDIREQGEPAERIGNLLDKLKLYLDPEKYSFDFVKVEQLLTEAVQVMDDTARGVRPKDLPEEIPFSDSLDEAGGSSPYSYAGDMSPEEYDRMMELYERDRHTVVVSQPQNAPEQALDEYPMPDSELTVADLETCGYHDGDLLPISKGKALKSFEQDLTIYMIEGGSASMALNPDEFQAHRGLFAVSREEWEESREFSSVIEDRMKHQEQREAAFLKASQDAFAIYQVRDGDALRDIRFEPLSWLESKGISVDHGNYDLAYTAPLTDKGSTDDRLGALWDRFNNDHPADYHRPSLSVSDIVALKQNGVVSCHYVDSFGFQEITDFLKPEKEALIDNSEGRKQQPGHKLLCVRIFDQDGEFHGGDTGPFDESRLNWWIGVVKTSIINSPGGAASFTVYQWDSETKSWSLYRAVGGHEMTYDMVNKTEFGWTGKEPIYKLRENAGNKVPADGRLSEKLESAQRKCKSHEPSHRNEQAISR